jgi:hypothetical protein
MQNNSFLPRDVTDSIRLLLTAREAATALAVSERTLWTLTQPRGPIPSLKLPGRGTARSIRYYVCDLEEWIRAETSIARAGLHQRERA